MRTLSMAAKMNRRQFLKNAARSVGVGAPLIIPASVLGRAGRIPPSERIVMGSIGVGNMGFGDMSACMGMPETQLVAVCDVKRAMRERAKQAVDARYGNTDCAVYNDFRAMLDRRDIDAVTIATLDSWHVLHALAAVRAGKDIYLEKPLGMSIGEIQVLREAVHRYGRVFQFGTQQRSSQEFRHACEIARSGRLGKLHTIKIGVGLDKPSGHPPVPMTVPSNLDYERWLGSAPEQAYIERRVHPQNLLEGRPGWITTEDFGLGMITNWGAHHMDIAHWAMGTPGGTSVCCRRSTSTKSRSMRSASPG